MVLCNKIQVKTIFDYTAYAGTLEVVKL